MNTDVRRRMRKRRTTLFLTQKAAAGRVGVSHYTWSQWETGKVDMGVDDLPAVCDVLQCSADWLLGMGDPEGTTEVTRLLGAMTDLERRTAVRLLRALLGDSAPPSHVRP